MESYPGRKTEKCIRLLQVLNDGNIHNIAELAEKLDTKPRNLKEYRSELELSGFYINAIPGRYGGYQLENTERMPVLKITPDELKAIRTGYNFCMSSSGFVSKQEYGSAMQKVFTNANCDVDNEEAPIKMKKKYTLMMSEKDIKARYDAVKKCIANKTELLMKYDFLYDETHIVKVHPYDIIMYDGEWRFFAWNTETHDIWYFKYETNLNLFQRQSISLLKKQF